EPGGLQLRLEAKLERVLLESGRERTASAPPQGEANRVGDLRINYLDGQYRLSWTYVQIADYDRNGIVSISDLTPIGIGFGRSSEDQAWDSFKVPDGDGNDGINLANMTHVGQNFGNNIDHWMLQNSYPRTSGWVDDVALTPG